MNTDRYEKVRVGQSIEDKVLSDLPPWIKIVQEYIKRADQGCYSQQKADQDYGR